MVVLSTDSNISERRRGEKTHDCYDGGFRAFRPFDPEGGQTTSGRSHGILSNEMYIPIFTHNLLLVIF